MKMQIPEALPQTHAIRISTRSGGGLCLTQAPTDLTLQSSGRTTVSQLGKQGLSQTRKRNKGDNNPPEAGVGGLRVAGREEWEGPWPSSGPTPISLIRKLGPKECNESRSPGTFMKCPAVPWLPKPSPHLLRVLCVLFLPGRSCPSLSPKFLV